MLPPANATGIYTLTATYLNQQTGETYRIPVPEVRLKIDAQAIAIPNASTDWVTRLRSLSAMMPKGVSSLSNIFEQISSINQYDPTQNYVIQARQASDYRLQQEPNNLAFAYNLALADVLSRKVNRAIAAFQRVTQLDSKNPNAYAYLAFVNLYDFRPKAAQIALQSALALNPNLPELHALNGVAALMQGNLVEAWQEAKAFERLNRMLSSG
jgi:tetratricopeptide (TPR) repeat protein